MKITTRFLAILFLFTISYQTLSGYSQDEKRAEKAALKCIDRTLKTAGKDTDYILDAIAEYTVLLSETDTTVFAKKREEVDSLLSVSGFYRDNHLNIDLLKNCMLRSYDLEDEKNDTTSRYYQLLSHLIYLSENPTVLSDISPALHLQAIQSILATGEEENLFYQVISFILFQGIVKEFENYVENRNNPEGVSAADTVHEQSEDIQIITIVEDDVEIEEEIFLPGDDAWKKQHP